MKKIINKIIYKTTIILLVLGFLIQTISMFPFYVFANTNNELNEVEINSVNNVDESSIRLLYEIEDLRSEYSKVFRRTDGKLEYAYYEDMVNYFDGKKYQEVDASYKLENNEYSQSISKYSVKLPKKINENKKIKLSFENSLSLEITYNDILKVEGNVIESETSTSKINELKNISGIVEYNNIFDKVNLRIESSGTKFKENIILNDYISNFSFSYNIKLKGLTLRNENNNISFIDENGSVIYEISPYFMYDSNMKYSEDINLIVEEVKTDEYKFTVKPSDEYLSSATYPVVIDPVITYTGTGSSPVVKVKVIDKYNNTSSYESYIHLRKIISGVSDLSTYSLLQIGPLGISSSFKIEYARINLRGFQSNYADKAVIKKVVTENISLDLIDETTSYYTTTSNDFTNVGNSLYTADFSDYVYANRYTAQLYEISPEKFSYNGSEQRYYKNTTGVPFISVCCYENGGLHNGKTYEEISASGAGNIYISHSTGDLVLEKNDFISDDQLVGLRHYYNSTFANNTSVYGSGFRISYNEYITVLNSEKTYLKYTNSTGYNEFFYYDSELSSYKSEDGNLYNINIIEEDDNLIGYKLTDENYYKVFNKNGYLTQISYNTSTGNENSFKTVNVYYNENNLISNVTVNNIKLEFIYLNGFLNSINVLKVIDGVEEKSYIIKYNYSNSNLIEIITYNKQVDNNNIIERVHYEYNDNDLLIGAYSSKSPDKFSIDSGLYEGVYLTYLNNRVSKYGIKTILQNDSEEDEYYDIVEITYQDSQTSYCDNTGYFKLYSFDYFNHTVSILDSLGYAVYYEYENFANELSSINPKYVYKNQIKYISEPSLIASSPIKNGSFEELTGTGKLKYWETSSANATTPNGLIYGTKVLEIKKDIYSSNDLYASQEVQLPRGTYTISAYGYMNYASSTNKNIVRGIIRVLDEDGNDISSSRCYFNNESIENKNLSFSLNEPENVKILISLESLSENYEVNNGDAFYVDNITFSGNSLFTTSNLIQEPSFESINSWEGSNISLESENFNTQIFGQKKLNLSGNDEICQEIFYETKSGDKFNIGGFVEYYNLTGNLTISARFYNSTSSIESSVYTMNFNPLISSLQYATSNIIIDEGENVTNSYDRIEIIIKNNSIYDAYVDNVFLYPTFIGTKYKYNDNGQVTEIEENKEKYTIEYEDRKIKKIYSINHLYEIEDSTNNSTYDLKATVVSKINETSNNVSMTQFDYLNYENNTLHSFIGNLDSEGIFTSNVYDETNTYILKSYDEFNYKTTYEYDYLTGELKTVKKYINQLNEQEYLEYRYTYNSLGQLITIYEPLTTSTDTMLIYSYDVFGQIKEIKVGQDEERVYNFTYDNYKNIETVSFNNQIIKSYEYFYLNDINTGLVSKETYPNQEYKRYEYNERLELVACYEGKLNEINEIEEILCYNVTYTAIGNIDSYFDHIEETAYLYNYDFTGNLTRININKGNEESFIEFSYNDKQELISQLININGVEEETTFEKNSDGVVTSTKINKSIFTNPVEASDSLKRVYNQYVSYHDTELDDVISIFTQEIEYKSSLNKPEILVYDETSSHYIDKAENTTLTSLLPSKQKLYIGENTFIISYKYDALRNVTQIIIDSPEGFDDFKYEYEYNYNNSLSKEIVSINNIEKLNASYTYDIYGNLTNIYRTKKEGIYSALPTNQEYTYNNNNQLITYTKDDITYQVSYDLNGNALSHLGATLRYDGSNLVSYINNNTNITYTYNASGIRTEKIVNGIKYEYIVFGNKIIQQNVYSSDNVIDYYLRFMYDENNNVLGFEIILNDGTVTKTVYYVKNFQNDIIKLVDETGSIIGEYIYDAYGNIINQNDLSIFASENPFRYKSYFHDSETNLYYCSTRYYSPEICRFISSDDVEYLDPESINGLNLYCYCKNNPIMCLDPSGYVAISTLLIISAIITGVCVVGGAAIGGVSAGMAGGDVGDIFSGIGKGALNGLIIGGGISLSIVGFGIGGTKILGSIMVTYGMSISANMVEVAFTQGKKSKFDGDSFWAGANDINNAMFANSGHILIGKPTLMSIPFYGTRITSKIPTAINVLFAHDFWKYFGISFYESTKATLLRKASLSGLALGYFFTALQYYHLIKSIFTTPDFENSRWILY